MRHPRLQDYGAQAGEAAGGLADGPGGGRGQTIADLVPHLESGDIVIDGGNSYYVDDIRRAKELAAKGIHYVDVGTSGGVWGLERGYCMMIGGAEEAVKHLDPIFETLAPGTGDIPRTPGREKLGGTAEQGYLHCGPNGAGHFVKMVHNGIEYGIMAAYAEGLSILRHANVGQERRHEIDAETTPLRDPEHYQYDLNLPDIAEVWRRGSVIASWLLDLTAAALAEDPSLAEFAGRVSDSGEGRWTIKAAIDEAVPVPVLSAALYERFSSRGEADFRTSCFGDALRIRRPCGEIRRLASCKRGKPCPAGRCSHEDRSLCGPDSAAREAARIVAAEAPQAVAERGRFVAAFSGGHTPWLMLRALGLPRSQSRPAHSLAGDRRREGGDAAAAVQRRSIDSGRAGESGRGSHSRRQGGRRTASKKWTIGGEDMSETTAFQKRSASSMTQDQLDQLSINTIRTLSMDAVQQAKSGPSRHADGAGAAGLHDLEPRDAVRSRRIRSGPTATASCCRTATHRCCCGPCCT